MIYYNHSYIIKLFNHKKQAFIMKVYHTPQPGFCIGIDIGTTTVSAVVLDITERKTVEVYTIDNASDIASDFV